MICCWKQMDCLGTSEGTLFICYRCGFEWLVKSKKEEVE